jgi:glycosyltransferase involved in cell wall biosynthesis
MMGHASNLPALLQKYDLFVMSSKFEGFPLSVFEAMASGVPLLLSNIAPLKSIVHNNSLYLNLDDPASTALGIADIYKGNIDINSLALNARKYAHDTVRRKKYIHNLLNIYDDILSPQKS